MRKFTKLTRDRIRALPAGQKISEHGIVAAKLADGDVRWYVNVMVDGQRIHRLIGKESDKVSRSDAEAFIEQARTDARHDRLNLPKGRKVALTVKVATKEYIDALEKTDGKNLKSKREHVAHHIVPYMGKMDITKVSDFTLQKLRKAIRDKGRSDSTANRVGATWNHMARWLYANKKTDKPLPLVKIPKERNRREYIFTSDDEKALLDAAAEDGNSQIALFLKVGFGTSMRHSEILSATYRNFDPVRRMLRVKVKGGRWRDQPLPQHVADALRVAREDALDKNGFIFPNPASNNGHTKSMRAPFLRCVLAAGLDPTKATPHAMRHTAITRFSEAVGGDAALVQRFSGHESLQMVVRYTHPSDRRVQDAFDRLAVA